jgi:hypothetical protein
MSDATWARHKSRRGACYDELVKRARRIGLAIGCALGLTPAAASANGRLPGANQVAISPVDSSTLLTRSTFGLLLSHDRGATWDWVCESALGFTDSQDPALGILANGSVIVGTYGGLVVSPDTGCNWRFVAGPLAGVPVVDIVVRRDHPATAYALLSKHTSDTDAGDPLYTTQIYATTDSGATWSPMGMPIDATALVETIEIAASDPARFYVSGVKGSGATSTGSFFVSTNSGAAWTEHVTPLDAVNERAPYIAAVDPSNADRVYVRTSGPMSSRLFVTDNAGVSFAQKWSGGLMLGFALAPDGSKVYVGGKADGVNVAATTDFAFTKKSATPVECLTATSGALYACSGDKTAGFTVGASTDDGATFAPLLHLYDVRGPLACAADASAAQCVAQWPALHSILGSPPDAGSDASPAGNDGGGTTNDAGNGANPGGSPASSSSCGCRTLGSDAGSSAAAGLGAVAIAALAWARGRAKRRR